ncbi:MAG: hypothetical protein QOH28_1558 [Actinomycetota bacterium]|jgi:hypothetical protein|nr:hypothetical protein [Actinomycetota bacterium]
MIDNPEIMRQLVNGRLDQRQHEAATRRLVRLTRRRHHDRVRMGRTAWFDRRRRTARVPGPAAA